MQSYYPVTADMLRCSNYKPETRNGLLFVVYSLWFFNLCNQFLLATLCMLENQVVKINKAFPKRGSNYKLQTINHKPFKPLPCVFRW
jgi:hypothetical protein